MYDWGSTVTLVTHSYARDNGWFRERHYGQEVIVGLAGKEVNIEIMYSVAIVEPNTGVRMRKLAIGVDYICEPIKRISTPAIVVDMFDGRNVPREQKGGTVELLIGTDWLEHMPVAVERVYSMQLAQSLFSKEKLLCGEVPMLREWQDYKHAFERRRREENMARPAQRCVHSQRMRLQNPPEVVTITSDEEEEERQPERAVQRPQGGNPFKRERRDGPSRGHPRGRGRGGSMLARGLLSTLMLALIVPAVSAFAVYDCDNITVPVESYSMLEPEA